MCSLTGGRRQPTAPHNIPQHPPDGGGCLRPAETGVAYRWVESGPELVSGYPVAAEELGGIRDGCR